MEKELYKIMQELKIKINEINYQKLPEYEKKLKETTKNEEEQDYLYRLFKRQYFLLKIKTILLSILTFGIYYKINKNQYIDDIIFLNFQVQEIEKEYDETVNVLAKLQLSKNNELRMLESYEKNINQINKFLSLMDSLEDNERKTILEYCRK